MPCVCVCVLQNCRVCVQCGTRCSSLLCESCSRQHDSTQLCSLCAGSLDTELHKDLLSCRHCKRYGAESPVRTDGSLTQVYRKTRSQTRDRNGAIYSLVVTRRAGRIYSIKSSSYCNFFLLILQMFSRGL